MTRTKLLNNFSWLFIEKVIRILGGLFVSIWVARYLGPSDYGILNYALAYTTLFMLFVKLGLDQIVVREIVKNPKFTNHLLGTAFGLKLIGSLIAITSIYFSLYFVETDSITKIAIYIISAGFVFQSVDVIDYFYQSQILSKYVVLARGGAFILSSLIKIYLIMKKYSVVYFALSYVLDVALASLFLMLIYKQTGGELFKWRSSIKTALSLLQYSWPLALSLFLISIYTKIDQVMIGNMLNTEQVGVYSAAVRLSQFWLFIPVIIVSTLTPYFINLRQKNSSTYYQQLMQLYSITFWMGVLAGVATLLFGENVIVLLFGEAYRDAYTALVFNIWAGMAMAHAGARGIWLIDKNLQIYRLYSNIISVFLNVLLNFLLIPKMGIAGAAIATLTTQSLGTWGLGIIWKPIRQSTFDLIKSINPKYIFIGTIK